MVRSRGHMRALVAGIAGSLVGAGCFIEQVNSNYCSNINGDTFCEQRHGEERPYCVFGSGPCLDGLPAESYDDPSFDGCVVDEPPSECYSPCGGGQAKEDLDTCLEASATSLDHDL